VNGGTVQGSGRGDAFRASVVTTPSGMTDLNTVLVNNPGSREMVRMSMADLRALEQLSGPAFDRAYVEKQVMAHQNALATLDRLLAQNNLSTDLRAMLVTQRQSVAMHLQMAQQLRASMM
jgi:putative membrane protein